MSNKKAKSALFLCAKWVQSSDDHLHGRQNVQQLLNEERLMDDLNDYSWCVFFPAAAKALCSYQNKRATLLKELYEALPAETGYLHDPERKPLKDIDPFSVFGILNRHISQEKKDRNRRSF